MKLSVRGRLYLSYGLLILIMTALGIYAYTSLKSLDGISKEISKDRLPNVQASEEMNTKATYFRVKEYKHIEASDAGEMNRTEEEAVAIQKDMANMLSEYGKAIHSDDQRNIYNKVKADWDQYMQVNNRITDLCKASEKDEAMKLLQGESEKTFNDISSALQELAKYNKDEANISDANADVLFEKTRMITIVAVVIAALLSIGTAFLIGRSITKPLDEMEAAAEQLAVGDLTGRDVLTGSRDEIGKLAESFNKMKNNLKDIICELSVTAEEVSETATELSAQAQQTSAAASENAATVEEIATTVEQVAQNTQDVSAASVVISESALEGGKGVGRVQEQINAISASSEKATNIIDELSQTLLKVTRIVDVITQIADQTNLLALNAAIEAARAGDQGRGFAVVADEVRKLAEQSAGAAKEINQLIIQVQSESKVAVETMNAGNQEVMEGVAVVGEVSDNLQGILEGISGFADKIQNVAAAAEQVSAGVQSVAGKTEEQNAAMEEVSAASEALTRMAEKLSGMAGRFKV